MLKVSLVLLKNIKKCKLKKCYKSANVHTIKFIYMKNDTKFIITKIYFYN